MDLFFYILALYEYASNELFAFTLAHIIKKQCD